MILPEEKSETLERALYKKGDSIVGIVTPNDREGAGFPKKTAPTVISNGPPLIVSSPSTKIEGSKYSYQVKANDPDNDLIGFTLKSHPRGMEIDPKTGLIVWEVKNGDKGNHSIEIEVSDPEGAKSFQRFTLAVDMKWLERTSCGKLPLSDKWIGEKYGEYRTWRMRIKFRARTIGFL